MLYNIGMLMVDTRIALNSGDELNAWVGGYAATRYTEPQNGHGSYGTLIANINTSWDNIRDKLRKPGRKNLALI